MSQAAHKGHGNAAHDGLRAAAGEKQREELFKASEREKQRIMQETAAYRLQGSAKFESSSNATEVRLAQSTVGLVSKEEFARLRKEAEAGGEAAEAQQPPQPPPVTAKEKPKKKGKSKAAAGGLSFEMDEEGDARGGEAAAAPPKKPKKNPAVDFIPEVAKEAVQAPSAASSLSKPQEKQPAAEVTKYPAGYTCVKETGKERFEIALEVMASASAPRNRVTGITSHSVSVLIQGTERGGDANKMLVSFLRSILGGNSVSCDILRGHKAPVKTVRIVGVESVDCVYHRLLMAHKFLK